MDTVVSDEMPISEARANLTEVANAVRLQQRCVTLTRRGTPQAVLVPVEVGEIIRELGIEAAMANLRAAPTSKT